MNKAIAIIGAGYVGLPLAVAFAQAGRPVTCIDADQTKVDEINAGRSLHRGRRLGRARPARHRRDAAASSTTPPVDGAGAILICLPTPLSTNREPDLTIVTDGDRGDRRATCSRARS